MSSNKFKSTLEDSEQQLSRLEKIVTLIKLVWGLILSVIISLGIIVLFYFSLKYDKNITLVNMNNWVGIILGFVATFMSIISMFLSFYNLEKTNDINRKNTQLISDLSNNLSENKDLLKLNQLMYERTIANSTSLEETVDKLLTYQNEIYNSINVMSGDISKIKESGSIITSTKNIHVDNKYSEVPNLQKYLSKKTKGE